MPSPRIAIVGGGPAGLTLGVLLQRQGIPFTIFELRNKPTVEEAARPSGMLDLHPGSGLTAVDACGLTGEFAQLTGECSEHFLLANRMGEVLFSANGNGKRPEISRNNLAALLRRHIPDSRFRWGHRLLSASRTAAGTRLYFGHATANKFDLVIGADGAWSRVRALLGPIKPHFTGMHCITLTVTHLTQRFPHLAKLVGSGSFCALGRRHAIVSQRGPLDSARLYVWLSVADEQFAATAGLAGKPASAAKDVLLDSDDLLGTFGPVIQDLVSTACDADVAVESDNGAVDVRAFYTLPHGWSWSSQPGVTLVGDAAHLMLPNGEGVNMAMLDALHLSRTITRAYQAGGGSFVESLDLDTFEKEMVARAEVEGKETDERIGLMFGTDDAAYDMAVWLKAMIAKAEADSRENKPYELSKEEGTSS